MFYSRQSNELKNEYTKSLSIIGSLSQLFSDSKVPYLYYRVAEKLFCNIFAANDLSRGDIAFDASKDKYGIGLKTFLRNNDKTFQKIAEFNRDRTSYENKKPEEIINIISNLRNERIKFAQNLSKVDKNIYHCIVRSDNKFHIFEEEMSYINIDKIDNVIIKNNTIKFNDGINEYSFNLSKSTLYKRFKTRSFVDEFDVKILKNPLKEIKECFKDFNIDKPNKLIQDTIYLPLYGKGKKVSPKSGLNQWNASGRARDENEIYIPIPAIIHKLFPNFFPPRDRNFSLHLPSKDILSAKVCQDNSKALMSNPNKALGKWLLRDVLNLKTGELLTYEKLETIGIDSVRIDKIDEENYEINFASIGSYESFLIENN